VSSRGKAQLDAGPSLPRARRILAQALGKVFGAAVLHVRHAGEVICEAAWGSYVPDGDPITTDAVFDLASLTKLFTGTALLTLFDRRRLSLADPLAAVIPEFTGRDARRARVTFEHLLTHTSGLPAHINMRDELGAQAVIARVCATPLRRAPGTGIEYSDLGFMLLGEAIARLTSRPLDAALEDLVCRPLGSLEITYRPPPSRVSRIVCTERDVWRNRLLRGEVHDENCWAMGGIAGHAGLFGTAADVARLAEMYRQGGVAGRRRVLARATAQDAVREHAVGIEERRGLAWALKASDHHSCGRRLSAASFGHTGYTGTSVWVDPQRDLSVVLLTNRVLMSREPEPIRSLRAAVHDAVVEDLDACA
jgi:CubicO group peptidase (beta-lactamase class C family)